MVKITVVILRLLVSAALIFFPISARAFPLPGEFEFNVSQGSKFCLGCHDGLLTRQVRVDHPIEVDYGMAQLKRTRMLKHVSQLDSAIKLENGKVGCTSCHDRNSMLPAKLVMSNAGSRLCRSCHDL